MAPAGAGARPDLVIDMTAAAGTGWGSADPVAPLGVG
jgi:hypothetical protein